MQSSKFAIGSMRFLIVYKNMKTLNFDKIRQRNSIKMLIDTFSVI